MPERQMKDPLEGKFGAGSRNNFSSNIVYNAIGSEIMYLTYAVSQGSVLGPLLFFIYIYYITNSSVF